MNDVTKYALGYNKLRNGLHIKLRNALRNKIREGLHNGSENIMNHVIYYVMKPGIPSLPV